MSKIKHLAHEWHQWIITNLKRGVPHNNLVSAMVEKDFDGDFAIQAITQIATTLKLSEDMGITRPRAFPIGFESHYANYEYGDSRITSKSHIILDKQNIKIAARLQKPDIVLLENLLTSKECDHLIKLSEGRLESAKVIDPNTGNKTISSKRHGASCLLLRQETPIVTRIEKRLSRLLNIPEENAECLSVTKYEVGEEYREHHDFIAPEKPGYEYQLQKGGQRTCTVILYLNEVEDGGQINFPEIGFSCLPSKGAALYFSYSRNGQLDISTLHCSQRVNAGERWVATQCFREKEFPYKKEMH